MKGCTRRRRTGFAWVLPGRCPVTRLPRRDHSTRSCLLTADAVVGDECGEDDAAEEGQRVLVVAGRDATPVLEPVEATLNSVAVTVGLGVEGWWSATA